MLARFHDTCRNACLSAVLFLTFGGLSTAGAEERLTTPTIAGVVAAETPVEFIRDGFKGTEGPLGLPDGSLVFTETQASRITRIAADGAISTFLENSNGANGLGINPRGELVGVQVNDTRVGVILPVERARTLADNFGGLPFGRPNDLVVDRKGGVYFTDSGINVPAGQAAPTKAVAGPAVYYITPDGALKRLADDIERPNGIQLSPDEKTLYVANTLGEYVLAYAVEADGTVGRRRNFARLAGWLKGDNGYASGADGLAVDAAGRLYVASNVGIEVFSPVGEALGIISLPRKPQNLAFAGPDKKSLYVVGRGAAYRVAVLTPGHAGRAK